MNSEDQFQEPVEGTTKRGSRFTKLCVSGVIVAAAVALFYLEENWRGRRAWERVRAELAAKGEVIDWKASIMAPPPDASNIMKAPGIGPEFITEPRPPGPIKKSVLINPPKQNSNAAGATPPRAEIELGGIEIVPPSPNAIAFEQLKTNGLAREGVLRAFVGRRSLTPDALWTILEKAPTRTVIPVSAASKPSAADVLSALSTKEAPLVHGDLTVREASNGVFKVFGPRDTWITATDFLARPNEKLEQLKAVHEAAKRPVCWLPGDYSRPFEVPMPNFVTLRRLAQYASSRAQAQIFLRNSAGALEEIQYIMDLRRLLEAKPRTLVSAMIDVAITGLFTAHVENGFAVGMWEPSELRRLQEIVGSIDLLGPVTDSIRNGERAGVCYLFENFSTKEVLDVFESAEDQKLWKRWVNRAVPRGWIYQNMANYASMVQRVLDGIDPKGMLIQPQAFEEYEVELESRAAGNSPTWSLAVVAAPNFPRAMQVTCKNQTYTREVEAASALELYRRENANYPDSLEALTPKFMKAIPRDVISNRPLKYRRIGATYLLYSPGWNLRDLIGPAVEASPETFDLWMLSREQFKDDWIWKGLPTATQAVEVTKN